LSFVTGVTTCASPHSKAALSHNRNGDYIDVIDVRARRTVMAPRDHAIDRGIRPLELGFDRAVAAVTHPSGHTVRTRLGATRIAKPHALNPSPHDDLNAFQT
jgi:hypothetical protein